MQKKELTTRIEAPKDAYAIKSKKNSYIFEDLTNDLREKRKICIIILTVFLILIYLILFFLPSVYTNSTMLSYQNNTTLATIHTTIGNNLLTALVTMLSVLLTAILVIYSKEAIKISNKAIEQTQMAIEQSKKEQQIRDIENRLEKFYIPTIDIIKFSQISTHYYTGNNNSKGTIEDPMLVKHYGFNSIKNYRYLAETKTCEKFESILKNQSDILKNNSIKKEAGELYDLIEKDIQIYNERLADLKE